MSTFLFQPNKRQKIVISTGLFTLGFLIATQRGNIVFHNYYYILVIGLISYLLTFWSLWEGITKLKSVMLLILPVLFSIGATGFYFIFNEVRWLTRFPTAIIFGLMYYGLLLTQNIIAVAEIRRIPLYRAASIANFIYVLITALFLFSILSTLNLQFYWNFLATFVITFPLTIQFFWSLEMEKVDPQILVYSLIIALILGEFGLALSFWPLPPTIWSLFLSTGLYILIGMLSDHLKDRLSKKVVIEYAGVGILELIILSLLNLWLNVF